MLDQRSTAILSHLVNAGTHVPAKELTEKFQISRRTVYYDIDKINHWLDENNLEPIRQVRGAGFILEKEAAALVPDKITLLKSWQYEYTPKERKSWIALYLLGRDGPLFVEDLMVIIRVSRNTILDDIKGLKTELHRFSLDLQFERKSGYTILGEEENKRKAIVYFLSSVLPNNSWQLLLSKISIILNSTADGSGENELFQIKDLEEVKKIVNESEKELNIQYTDDFFHSLLFRLIIFAKRIYNGKFIQIDRVEREVLSETAEYDAALNIGRKLENLFKVSYPKDEILYITKHLLSSKIQSADKILFDNEDSETKKLSNVITNMIKDFEKYACVFLKDRNLLAKNLLLHMKPSYYRIKYELEVENQVAELMKEKYPDIFQITKKVIFHLEKELGKPVNDNETALIAMHFGGWMKRTGVTLEIRKKALIVCASGLGTSKLLENQLEELFPLIDFVGSTSLRQYESSDYDVDFIVATVPVEEKGTPIFIVSPILTETEKDSLVKKVNGLLAADSTKKASSVDALMDIIQKHTSIKDSANLEKDIRKYLAQQASAYTPIKKPSLAELLTKENIVVKDQVKDWQEAIREGSHPLLKNGYITENYVKAMIYNVTRLGPYIIVAPKLAIPHAKPEDGVKKLGMSLLSLKEGVKFSESEKHKVNILVILAAVDGEAHLKALSEMTKLFSSEKTIEKIVREQSADNILEFIAAGSDK